MALRAAPPPLTAAVAGAPPSPFGAAPGRRRPPFRRWAVATSAAGGTPTRAASGSRSKSWSGRWSARGSSGRKRGDGPLEVEIGSGKGSFLVAEAEARPGTLFLGIERARRYWLYAADRLRRRAQANARILRGGRRRGPLRAPRRARSPGSMCISPIPGRNGGTPTAACCCSPPSSAPPRRRWRRAASSGVVTDDSSYFTRIEEALARRPRLVRARYRPPESARPGELAGSNFERKYRLEGRPIRAAAAVRSADEDDALADEER